MALRAALGHRGPGCLLRSLAGTTAPRVGASLSSRAWESGSNPSSSLGHRTCRVTQKWPTLWLPREPGRGRGCRDGPWRVHICIINPPSSQLNGVREIGMRRWAMPIQCEGPCTPTLLSHGLQVHVTVLGLLKVSLASESSYRPSCSPTRGADPEPRQGSRGRRPRAPAVSCWAGPCPPSQLEPQEPPGPTPALSFPVKRGSWQGRENMGSNPAPAIPGLGAMGR